MTYSFQKNINLTSNGAIAIYSLKELLKTKGWTVPLSTDGYFVDGYDRITQSGWGGVNNLNPNSWFVLRMPLIDSVQREFVIQMGSSTQSLSITYSYDVSFSGGTTTTAPTASGSATVLSGTNVFATLPQSVYIAAGDVNDGYNFYMIGIDASVSTRPVKSLFAMDRCLSGTYPTDDIDPYIIWSANGSTDMTTTNISNGSATETSLLCSGWFGKGGLETFARLQGFAFREPGGSYLHTSGQTGYGTNGIGGYTDILPIITGRGSASYSAPKGVKGTSSIFNWYCTSSRTGDTYKLVTDRDKVVFSDVIAPWDGTVPIV
jgi:hypothetical protein